MKIRRTLALLVFALSVLPATVKNWAADLPSGEWAIKADEPGKVDFSLTEHHQGGSFNDEDDWPMISFPGVDFSKPGRQDVHFTIARDAGKIECEGFLNNGEGTGTFHFHPDPNYALAMRQLDFSIDEQKQYRMAVFDVSLEFARQMRAEHLTGLDADKLIAFRIHEVDSAFIAKLRAAGLKITDSDMLVDEAKPPVTKYDVRIVQRARDILNSESKWDRADTRVCPGDAKAFSLYCALEKATNEVTGEFEHRGAAMQEARFVIDEIARNRKNYHHRLMDYNNDPATTFADVQEFFRLLEKRITRQLGEEESSQ